MTNQIGNNSRREKGPGARKIYQQLKRQIIDGVYGNGGKLPSSRALAVEFGVSRNTVTVAYDQLLAEGFITVSQGSRPLAVPAIQPKPFESRTTEIAADQRLSEYAKRVLEVRLPSRSSFSNTVIDFRYGDISADDFPTIQWRKALNQATGRQTSRLSYGDPKGSPRLRAALQAYLWRARSIECSSDQIVIVNGSQQGLELCARILLDPGDTYAIEEPCYPMARHVFTSVGTRAIGITVDADGVDAGQLAGLDARLAYVTPSHQFPLGSVLSINRRQQLLQWAEVCGSYIVEDDYDGEYRYDIKPIPPLRALSANSNVVYVGTVSKTLSPTLRIGYMVLPSSLVDVFTRVKLLSDRHAPALEQEALAAFIESGAYEGHIRRIRRLNGKRRASLLDALSSEFGEDVSIVGADAGLHLVVWFHRLTFSDEDDFATEALSCGVAIYSMRPHFRELDNSKKLAVVMGYAALTDAQISKGVTQLRKAYDRLLSR
ncbi:PLP-dependent aminotransferase family protein [Rhizobium sp. BK060]|uniref:MocR-like pyridoxine biosynthesis transcription factor PdxR n=1 Tax=Rhizobium sp. BK060 TaxID=2587096 RepID=UPI00160C08A9|nr:PLP-dependent aminotransferase family protein [Rhizobium sp. BK060]MBB3394243.1 GntR family transcriptional regulator/MocR family aminotransferase [Rhizobium sp. BK060]